MSRRPKAVEQSVARAINQAHWLQPTDQAAVRLARRLAELLDELYEARDLFGHQLAGKVTYTAQTLLRVLQELGLTAQARDMLGLETADDSMESVTAAMADVVPLQ